MRKIVMSGLVAAAALIGCAGPAFAGTGTAGTGTTGTGTTGTGTTGAAGAVRAADTKAAATAPRSVATAWPAFARALRARGQAGRIAASRFERLSAARAQADQTGFMYLEAGISCASPTACLSVGAKATVTAKSATFVPAAQRLHGGTWKAVPVKAPKGPFMTMLDGVSCKAATYCLVVGDALGVGVGSSSDGTKVSVVNPPVILSWDGTTLTPVAAPPVPKGDELQGLSGVSCVAVKSCVVLGSGDVLATGATAAFIWTLNGGKWALRFVASTGNVLSRVAPTGTSTFYDGLRCFSLTSCVVIGASDAITASPTGISDTSTPLVASWNGTALTSLNAPAPGGADNAQFNALSCVSVHACAVVGNTWTANGSITLGFADVWNGKTWAVTKWSGPKGDNDAELTGVSCTSAVRCIAVGMHGTDSTTAPAALAWGGSKWTLLKVPGAGSGKLAGFGGVSCPVNGKCVATGEIGTIGATKVAVLPLAGYWNGSAWKYGPMFPAAAALPSLSAPNGCVVP